MEKRTPHTRLSRVKALANAGKIRTTYSALMGAASLGLDYPDLMQVVLGLSPKDFHKSMTTYGNHRIWQDVYHPRVDSTDVYLKLTVIDDVLIVSFKEL